jgi:organic radical activating enzyme
MKKWFLPVLIFAHLLYLQALTFYPYPELFTYPYLASKGFLPFRDILDQHFPTLLDLPINLWNLGMHTELSAKIVFFVLIVITHVLLYKISKKLLGNSINSLLPNLLYVALQPLFDGGTFWIDTFITPLALGVFLCILYGLGKGGRLRIKSAMTSGLLLGVALVCKQTTLPFVAGIFALLFLIKKTRGYSIILGIFTSIPFLLLCYWIYSNGLWNEFSYWTVTFNTNVYSKMSVIYPTISQLGRVLLVWGTPIALYIFTKKKSIEQRLLFVSVITLSFFAVGRFGFSYLQVALPFVVLLFVYSLLKSTIQLPKQFKKQSIKVQPGIIIFIVVILLALWHMRYFSTHSKGDNYFASQDTIDLTNKIKEKTDANDHIFILGGNPILYPLTETVPSGHVFTVAVPWNYSVTQDRIVKGLEEDPPKLIVVEENAEIDGQKVGDFGKEVLEYIKSNYEKEEEIEGYTFYEPNVMPDSDPASDSNVGAGTKADSGSSPE